MTINIEKAHENTDLPEDGCNNCPLAKDISAPAR
jgi:hypothetical protein